MTEQETQSVLAATSLDIDEGTWQTMEIMLAETEKAERKTIRLVSSKLPSKNTVTAFRTGTPLTRLLATDAVAKCGPEVMGEWSELTVRVFRPRKLRYEVLYRTPRFYTSESSPNPFPYPYSSDTGGLSFIDGTEASHSITRASRFTTTMFAGWATLLALLQKMEGQSRSWQQATVGSYAGSGRHSLISSVKRQQRTWDSQTAFIDKPVTEISFSVLMRLAAMLGIHWKEVDTLHDEYLAEGNGIVLRGFKIPDWEVLFSLQIVAGCKFTDNRVIPSLEVKDLCRGWLSFETWGHDNVSFKLGSPRYLHRIFVEWLGCDQATGNYFLDSKSRVSHLFPGKPCPRLNGLHYD